MNTSDFTENRFLKLIDNIDQRGTSQSDGVPFSPFRPFEDLSMKERAAVIRIGVQNGLRDLESIRSKYNEYADGGHIYDGESEETQQMNITNSYPMSLQDYIAQRIQDTRDSAINVMNTREYPKVYFNSSPDYITKFIEDKKAVIKEIENNIIKEYAALYRRGAAKKEGSDLYNLSHRYIEGARDNIRDYNNDISLVQKYGKAPEGATCIFTVTDSYGNERAVPGNMSWLAKGKSGRPIYEEKGFKLLKPTDTLLPGDMIQWVNNGIPEHSLMNMEKMEQDNTRTSNSQLIKATYSNGSYGKGAMRRNETVRYSPKKDNVFRFVGNAADSARWINEYNALIGNNEIANNNEFASGGSIHIKPENRGKFTALKKRTGHSASWFKAHGTPAQKKMATFALNARKWKHGDGGHLYDGESEDTQWMDVLSTLIDDTKDYAKDKAKGALKGLMSYVRQASVGDYNPKNLFRDANMYGVPEATFLMPKQWQEQEFMKNGYIKGKEGDYGLVTKAVGERNLPIYQTAPDAVSRDNLIVIDNVNDRWLGDNAVGLQNPSHFPSALYSDRDGNVFQKAWDLNDYGGSGGSTASKLGQILDYVGNPTVVTTGFQPVVYNDFNAGVINKAMEKKGLYPIMENNTLVGWGLPEVEVFGNKKKYGGPIVGMVMGGILKNKNRKNKGS